MANGQLASSPLHWLNENFERIFLVAGLLSIILFITWQVIYRYIITLFIERAGAAVWTEELSRYVFIWISYLALCVAIRKRSSIRVDMLYETFPPRLQRMSWILVETLFLALVRLGADRAPADLPAVHHCAAHSLPCSLSGSASRVRTHESASCPEHRGPVPDLRHA